MYLAYSLAISGEKRVQQFIGQSVYLSLSVDHFDVLYTMLFLNAWGSPNDMYM